MIPELLKSISGSTVRWALTGIGAILIDRGVLLADDMQKLIAGGGLLLATLAWSFWQKYKARILFLVGLNMPAGTPEDMVKTAVGSGHKSSVWSILLLISLVPLAGSQTPAATMRSEGLRSTSIAWPSWYRTAGRSGTSYSLRP